jgi:hypothetical protein
MSALLTGWCCRFVCCRRLTSKSNVLPPAVRPGPSKIGGAKAVAALVTTVTLQPKYDTTLFADWSAIEAVLSEPANKVIAVREGAIPALVTALQLATYKNSPVLVNLLCRVCVRLVEDNSDHQSAAARAGALSTLLGVITANPDRPDASIACTTGACDALRAAVFDNPAMQALAVDANALPVLIGLLSSKDPRAATAAARLIRTLTVFNAAHAEAARAAGAIAALELAAVGFPSEREPEAAEAIKRTLSALV